MKKIFILLLVFVVGKGVSQTTIYSDDCSLVTTFSVVSSDWLFDNSIVYPTCTVVGTSGADKLIAQQANNGSFENATTIAINTSTFVNIQATWNMIRGTATSPALTFQWSNDAGGSWNTVSFTAPTVGSWGAVPSVSLPAAASGTIIYVRWTYTSNGDFNDYVGLDDIKISGTPSPSYYWNGVGALNDPAQWGVNTDGSGGGLSDFTTPNTNLFIRNAASATLSANWTISGSGSVLNVGDGTVPNSTNLVIPSTFALTISGGSKLNVSNNSTLTIQNTSFPILANVVLGSSSTINFAQSSAVTIWATTYGNLIFSGSGNRSQGSGVTAVTGSFIIGASNNYVMVNSPASSTQLSGAITCNGGITTALSNLTIDGSSSNPIGTLNFNGTNTINNLVLSRAGQTLTLGSNLAFSGALAQSTQFTNGSVNLNGKLMAINGPVVFPASTSNGVFIGSTSSSLSIGGSGNITNSLLMDQTSSSSKTSAFTLSRSGSTVTLGNDLIAQAAIFTDGNLDLNGKSLTLNSAITFPASTSNGVFIGSTTSSLAVGGTGSITNSMLMSQSSTGSRSLGMFSLTRTTSTLTLGNNLIVSGTTDLPNGIIDINGTLLTLSGPINFPTTSSFGRGMKGSLTSSLTINGSGAITNSLFMNSGIQLSDLTMNRSGQTLTLGNTLEVYGVVNPLAGTVASGGNLFIRSNATNKGRIAAITGVLTGNIKVETYAAGGVTDWTNLGPSGVNGLTVASWEGQIPMTCFSCPNDQTSAGGYFVSIQSWDPTKLSSDPTAYVEMSYTTPLNPAQGYWTYLGDALGTTSALTWTVTGAPTQGNINIPLTTPSPGNFSEGFNLISNPYPSPILWSSLWNSNANVDNAIYVYSPEAGGTTSYAGGVSSDPVNGITNVIPMGQGFYVQAVANATLVAQESNKTSSNSPLLKTTEDIGSVVRLRVDGGGFYDMTAIRFHGDATPSFDRTLDARKLFASPGYIGYLGTYTQRTSISTKSGDEDYSINSLPYAQTADAVIPVLVKVYATGQHTITGTDLENLPNSCVILKDKLTNTTQDLKMGGYVCTINDTTSTPRFELRVCMDISMSVDEAKNWVDDKSIVINNDANGVYVKFDYDKATKSNISVTNILGQKVIDDKSLTTVNDKVYLNLDPKQQLVFITVTTDNKKVTKKVIR